MTRMCMENCQAGKLMNLLVETSELKKQDEKRSPADFGHLD
jgi:hypothetical protein